MFRLGGMLVLSGLLIVAATGTSAEEGQEKKAKGGSPEQVFKRLDTNGDDKLDRDEFLKLAELIAARARDKGKEISPEQVKAFAEVIFKRMDANGDGGITLEEMKKAREQRGDGKNKKNKDAE